MDPNKIRMSIGGERIEEVIGRSDDDELPSFEKGSFRLRRKGVKKRRAFSKEFLDKIVHQGQIMKHTMKDLFQSMEVVDDNQDDFNCSQVRVLLLNLFLCFRPFDLPNTTVLLTVYQESIAPVTVNSCAFIYTSEWIDGKYFEFLLDS